MTEITIKTPVVIKGPSWAVTGGGEWQGHVMTISRLAPKWLQHSQELLGERRQWDVGMDVRSLILTELEATQNSKSQSALGMLKGNSCLETNFKGEKNNYWSGICEQPDHTVEAAQHHSQN